MRLLLDENLPHQMRLELPGHDVFTAAYMGWAGVENGEPLRLAAAACVVLSTQKNKGNRMDNQKPLNNEDINKVAGGGGGGIDRGGPLPAQLVPKITSQGTKDAGDVTLDPPALGLAPTNTTT